MKPSVAEVDGGLLGKPSACLRPFLPALSFLELVLGGLAEETQS